jgi:hypothetical protein
MDLNNLLSANDGDNEEEEKPAMSVGSVLKQGFGKMFVLCPSNEGSYSVLKDKYALWACLNYALIGSFMIFDAEIWPLLTVLKPSSGGLGFTTREIGIAQATTGISFMITSLFLQTRITNKMGFINASIISALVWAAQNLVTPFIHFAVFNPFLLWTFVVLNRLVRGFVGQLYFGCSMAFINNSVIKEHLGAVNGMGQTLVSLARTAGPFLSANLFAWSASNGLSWPLNQHFVYIVVVIMCLGGALEAYLLPRSLNKPKEEQFQELKEMVDLDDSRNEFNTNGSDPLLILSKNNTKTMNHNGHLNLENTSHSSSSSSSSSSDINLS